MKKLTTLLFWVFTMSFLSAQTTIKGNVVDAENKTPIIGAIITTQGNKAAVTTDELGRYELKIPANSGNSTLVTASFVGFKSVTASVALTTASVIQDFKLVEADVLGEVIVSANKKVEKVQDVAMSISVLSPLQLRRTGATEFRDYASAIPNLGFGTQGGGGAFNDGRISNQISLRGIAGANTTAMYLDDTPLPSSIDPRLIDIARIEVLRGPQGSLYGSSTMGGAVKVITNQPNNDQKEGSISIETGKVQEGTLDYGVNGVINLPIANNKAAVRIVGFYDHQTGVYDRVAIPGANILNTKDLAATITGDKQAIPTDKCTTCGAFNKDNVDSKNKYGFQASAGFNPIPELYIVPKIIYQNLKGDGYDFADNNTKNFKQNRASGVAENFSDAWTHYSVSANLSVKGGKIVSSTSYLDRAYKEQEDEGTFLSTAILEFDPPKSKDFWAGVINRNATFKKFAQELRYQSESTGKLNTTIGVYYGDETLSETSLSYKKGLISYLGAPTDLENVPWFDMNNKQHITELALFGELYYDITPQLRATVGARYFSATSNRDYFASGAPYDYDETTINQNVKDSGLNPKLNLTYRIDKSKILYATVSKGYRLGGLNAPLPPLWCKDALAQLKSEGQSVPDKFTSDFLWNYEAGIKTSFNEGKIIANAAVFYNDWKNLQQRRFFPDCGLGFVSNVGSASSTGIEIDVKAKVANGLDLGFALGVLDAKIKQSGTGLDAKVGDRILFTPKSTIGASAQYTKDFEGGKQFYIRADIQHVGERYSSFAWKTDAARVLKAYELVNARAGYVMKHYEISVFANNLTGAQANFGDVTSLAAETPGRPRYMTNRPRTIGVQVRAYF